MPHACKENAPVNVKEKYVCEQSSMGLGMGVCTSSLNKSPVHSYLWVYVCVCVCNRSAPGSAIKETPQDVCVFVHM